MKRAARWGCLLLCLLPALVQPRFARPSLAQRLALLMENRCDALGVPGIAMAVVEHGRLIYEGGYGYADPSASLKAGPSTAFRIGGLAPALTALALLRLQDERHLYLVNPIGFYLDDLPPAQAATPIGDLLARASHGVTSGARPRGGVDEKLLQQLVARVSGRSFRDYLHDSFIDPLGLTRTGPVSELATAGIALAKSYAPAARGRRWVSELPATLAPAAPGERVELASCVSDLRVFAQALLARDFVGGSAYHRLGFDHPGGEDGWSLGWHSDAPADFGGMTLVSTSGDNAEDSAAIWLLPQREAFVVVLADIAVPGVSDVGRAAAHMAFMPPAGPARQQ